MRSVSAVRARNKHEHLPWLWLSSKGRLTSSGSAQMIKRRCKAAGIPAIHPHQFRHTFSHLWLVGGGNEHDLAKLNGWSPYKWLGATHPRLLVIEPDWLIKGSRQATTFRGNCNSVVEQHSHSYLLRSHTKHLGKLGRFRVDHLAKLRQHK